MTAKFKKKDSSKEDSFEFKRKKSSFGGKPRSEKKFSKGSDPGKARFSDKDKPSFSKKFSTDTKSKFSSSGDFNKEKKSSFSNFKKKGPEASDTRGRGTFGAKAGKAGNSPGKFSDKSKSDSPRKFNREQKDSSAKPEFKKKSSSYNDYRKKGADTKSPFGSREKVFRGKSIEKRNSPENTSKKSGSDFTKKFNKEEKGSFVPKGKFEGEKKFSKNSSAPSKYKSFDNKKSSDTFSKSKDNFRKPFNAGTKDKTGKFDLKDKKDFKKKTKIENELSEFELKSFDTNPSKSRSKPTDKPASETLRLNRYISNAGVCSRRDADTIIKEGMIKVNGNTITEMGYQVKPGDVVKYGNRILNPEKQVYILLNKPKDFITTMDDPDERKTVMDLVKNACKERVYPVGRLDRNTTGLLLLTNDGELADKLTHPSNEVKKIYQVELDKPITEEDFEKIQQGLTLEDGPVKVDDVAIVSSDRQILGMEIHVGRNRIVRRIFEHLGYEVVQLDRVMYAGLSKKDLPRGKWRFLTEKELIKLRYFV